jgi:hypothetical protein
LSDAREKRAQEEHAETDHQCALEPPTTEARDPCHPKRCHKNGVRPRAELKQPILDAALLRLLLGRIDEREASESAVRIETVPPRIEMAPFVPREGHDPTLCRHDHRVDMDDKLAPA